MNTEVKRHVEVPIKKSDDERQIVYGEVYVPNVPDSQNEFMTEDSIMDMAHNYMRSMRVTKVDTLHDNVENGSCIVESFIARKGDPDFIEGAWVVGCHCSDEVWKSVKKGELNGFSMEALVIKEDTELEVAIPESVSGGTNEVGGHTHTFKVEFDDKGRLRGGHTDFVNGHSHSIMRGTLTEESLGHSHTFSFIEMLK